MPTHYPHAQRSHTYTIIYIIMYALDNVLAVNVSETIAHAPRYCSLNLGDVSPLPVEQR
jgi:hypothetical protein